MPSARRLRARLLVATPTLLDPNFARTVVFVLEHTPAGAIGVVLNRPTPMPVGDLIAPWAPVAAAPAVVFLGGPVAPDGAIGLGRRDPGDGAGPAAPPLLGDVGTVDLETAPADSGTRDVRVFAGHAGWGPGQLEREIAEGSWFTLDGEPDDVLTREPGELWRSVLARQPGRIRVFANAPMDPTQN